MSQPIVLLTDFGTQDSYVGVMKGVIAGIAPDARVIDLSHEIRPQDLAHAAYTLRIAAPYFPDGTIFCCVVDPGVGSARRAVAVEAGPWRFVLPDNGLLTRVLEQWPARRAVSLTNRAFHLPQHSATFHGRDIFAPASAHLASGVALEALGERVAVETLQTLDLPATRRDGEQLIGSVMHVDHFGNLITTISREQLGESDLWQLALPACGIGLPRIAATFAAVAPGEPVAYLGSDGFLELALRNGNAARAWGVGVGAEVVARRAPP